jgi:hypothetical protein
MELDLRVAIWPLLICYWALCLQFSTLRIAQQSDLAPRFSVVRLWRRLFD